MGPYVNNWSAATAPRAPKNKQITPITISSAKNEDDAVLISKSDWDAIKETMYLENNGVGDVVRRREKDDSGFTDVDDIDWDKL